ncbi:MAG: ATP-binding protein [Alphaproteobacteria bacterium]|nr:ATP-binding protein [Alphaproteobacteria bacterium]
MDNERSRIVHASAYVDALKSSGYKSTYNAISEIVDNSIDAEANNVFIIGEQKQTSVPGGRAEKRIVSFAFLDDGTGMDFDILKGCLSIGYSTNAVARRGMGRFGVGLPQASVFVCDRVEVYSWQDGIENCMMTYLDLDLIKEKDLNELDIPVAAEIPKKYKKYLNWKHDGKQFDFNSHGTLVVWTKCTNVNHKKWPTCVSHMAEDLGRKYRYFINDKNVNIAMCELVSDSFEYLLPNDPLYLMDKSQECLKADIVDSNYTSKKYNPDEGYTECMFDLFKSEGNDTGIFHINIKFEDHSQIKEGVVTVKCSVIKEKYYSKNALKTETKPGSLAYGKTPKIKSNVGISIVRQCREIDFGSFGFINIYNTPEHRWWGLELSFGPDLDEAFGISNNKQYVDLKPMSEDEQAEYMNEPIQPVWMQLNKEIEPTIKAMLDRNSKIREESLVVDDTSDMGSETGNTVSKAEEAYGDGFEPETDMTPEEEKELVKQAITDETGIENPSDEQYEQFSNSNVRFKLEQRDRTEKFLTSKYVAKVLIITINTGHDFYKHFVRQVLEDSNDGEAFKLLIAAIIKTMKELDSINPSIIDVMDKKMNDRLFEYMTYYKKDN